MQKHNYIMYEQVQSEFHTLMMLFSSRDLLFMQNCFLHSTYQLLKVQICSHFYKSFMISTHMALFKYLHKQRFLFATVENVFVKVRSFLSLPQEIKQRQPKCSKHASPSSPSAGGACPSLSSPQLGSAAKLPSWQLRSPGHWCQTVFLEYMGGKKKTKNLMMFQVILKSKHHVTYFIAAFLLGRLTFVKDHFDHILPPKHLRLLIHQNYCLIAWQCARH